MMTFSNREFTILISLFSLVVLVNCSGNKAKSQLAELESIPEEPIVITGPTTDIKGQKIDGPYFSFRLRMSNGSNEAITIVALAVDVFAQNTGGQIEKTEVTWSPQDFNYQYSDTVECKYSSFGTWDAGQSKALALVGANGVCATVPVFIVGSNKTGVSGSNFRYRVKAKPLGWFGTFDEATDRFDRYFYFFTR